MSNTILTFLEERKQARLKKPGTKTNDEIESDFSILNWVGSAARRAGQLSMVSHPGKFSHPDAKISSILYADGPAADGYLRSGNCETENDVLGNAAALDVFAFLSLVLPDGQTVFTHVEQKSTTLRELLGVSQQIYDGWCTGLMAIKQSDPTAKTDGKVKQVYFPVGDAYHLLSILTPSGMLTENRERLVRMKPWGESKEAREQKKAGKHSESGYDEIWGVLTVKYGGTQPQNISKLNSRNAGEAWLLPSLPPILSVDHVRIPRRDFFANLRWDERLKTIYASLHRLFKTDYNNVNVREARKKWFESIFDWVFFRAAVLQQHSPGWSEHESVQLPLAQKIWLDSARQDQREENTLWRQEIAEAIARWSIVTYRKMRKGFGDDVALGHTEETSFTEELKAYTRASSADVL